MPRFSIYFVDEGGTTTQPGVADFRDLEAARLHAMRAAGELIAQLMSADERAIRFNLCIDAADGERLVTLPVALHVGTELRVV
jgi:hypothetical protein